MLLKSLAKRYAQALYRLAVEEKKVDERLMELVKTRELLSANPQLSRSLTSPAIPYQVKKAILRRILDKSVSPLVLHFLYVVVDKSREVYINPIIESYKELMRESRGELECTIQVPQALSEKLLSQTVLSLTQRTGKKVQLKVEVVPELLGGMVVIIGDNIIDGSIRAQLGKVQERFAKATAAAAGG